TPPGAPEKEYQPGPFAAPTFVGQPFMRFSPDGKQILLLLNPGTGEQVWLIPYPADASRPPRRIHFRNLPAPQTTPQFSWMPDSPYFVSAPDETGGPPPQLYLADTVSGEVESILSSTAGQRLPAVSPDGARLIFMEESINYDIVTVDLATAAVTPL